MYSKSYKGQTLIELMLVVAVTAIVMPVIFSILIYGFKAQTAYSKYMQQHDKVTDAIQRIRKDVEEAKKVTVNAPENSISIIFSNNESEKWTFSDDALKLNGEKTIDMLDTSSSGSSFSLSGDGSRLVLEILPKHTNNDTARESNVWEPIITEFSVRYKK